MHHLRTLIAAACLMSFFNAQAQSVPCAGEPLIFEVEGEYYGTKTWEHSTDRVTWNTVEVVESEPFILQPEQSGWYRVRFHDEACDVNYFSEPQRFVAHTIDLGAALTISIGGVVRNELGGPVSGATVRAGCGAGVSTTTDHYGVYLLEGVTAREGMATVTVEKEGYFTGTRSFVPGESAADAISHAYITLLQKNLAGTVSGTTGGTLNLEGVTITFAANAFTQNGAPYTGPVSVYLNHIDPTSVDLHGQMPGMLMGVQDDQPQLLYSFGMAGVELADAAGNAVQLAPGSSATVRFPVLAAQQAAAPASIPLWWFDEDLGYWVEEGEAQRVGNEYVGQVAHFSWWNCDVPGNFVALKGDFLDLASGSVLANAQIKLITTNMGTGIAYTNAEGEFNGMVPIDQVLTLQVWLPCGPLGANRQVHEETVGPFAGISAIEVLVGGTDLKLVRGEVLDCVGMPVEEGYVWASGPAVFCSEGTFEFTTCASSITLRAVDLVTGNVGDYLTIALNEDTTDLGGLLTCTPMFGTVSDIDGNTYPTVLIGTQEWMAANLKTTRYNDGSAIPEVTEGIPWNQLTTGARCNYNNDTNNVAIYGRLYNWHAAIDPNVCPQGWHVPMDAEWQQLELTLGMPADELDTTVYRGIAQNVGGKLKATTLWTAPNTGATDESGFRGLPGGGRQVYAGGSFDNIGYAGGWWSASDLNAASAYYRLLIWENEGFGRFFDVKTSGLCLRCVRD